MATSYPTTIDSFLNPVSTKVNGQDYVKAEHINDVQDSIRAMQISLIGSGVSVNFGSNYFVPGAVSFKSAIEILDSSLEGVREELETHTTLSMITDSPQHHANVLEFSSGSGAVLADITPKRVQTALEVIRQEINQMLAGGYVRGQSLSDLYILKSGPAVVTGTMEVQGDFQADSNVQLGSSTTHSTLASGDLQVGRNFEVIGDSILRGDIELSSAVKIGLEGSLGYGFLSFDNLEARLQSLNDIVLKLDSNGLVDGLNQTSQLKVLDSVDQVAFSVNELGEGLLKSSLLTGRGFFNQDLNIGSSNQTVISSDSLETSENEMRILLDKGSIASGAKLTISRDGYTGSSVSNDNVMMQATESELYSGTTVLKPNLKENGTFALKFQSNNPGGEFQGYWVPFRQKKMNIPSVNITLNTADSVNVGTVQVGSINQYGFFVECDSVTAGMVYMFGTYEA